MQIDYSKTQKNKKKPKGDFYLQNVFLNANKNGLKILKMSESADFNRSRIYAAFKEFSKIHEKLRLASDGIDRLLFACIMSDMSDMILSIDRLPSNNADLNEILRYYLKCRVTSGIRMEFANYIDKLHFMDYVSKPMYMHVQNFASTRKSLGN